MIEEIKNLLEKYGSERTSLIPILEEIQKNHSRVSKEHMHELAMQMGITPLEIQSVITFYGYIDEKVKGEYIIRLCATIACNMSGEVNIAEHLEKALGIKFGESTYDKMFTLEYTSCIGMCDNPPAMLVDEDVYTGLTPEKIDKIIDLYRLQGTAKEYAEKKEKLMCEIVDMMEDDK